MKNQVDIFTDGACSGNPGPGGWGAIVRFSDREEELYGGEPSTTNNRMELLAVIAALRSLPEGMKARVHTDSQYVQKGITEWIHNWKKRGWTTADRKPVKNVDLWQSLETEAGRHSVEWKWIRGHAGHAENERADALARRGAERSRTQR